MKKICPYCGRVEELGTPCPGCGYVLTSHDKSAPAGNGNLQFQTSAPLPKPSAPPYTPDPRPKNDTVQKTVIKAFKWFLYLIGTLFGVCCLLGGALGIPDVLGRPNETINVKWSGFIFSVFALALGLEILYLLYKKHLKPFWGRLFRYLLLVSFALLLLTYLIHPV